MDLEVLNLLRDAPVQIDGRGHDTWRVERDLADGPGLWYFMLGEGDEVVERISSALRSGVPLEESILLRKHMSYSCQYCGADSFTTDGFNITAATECPHPDGFVTRSEIEVPSGKLVFGNDFREVFPDVVEDFYVNEATGIRDCTEAYGRAGMFHFFVGNTCPGVYVKDGVLDIANPAVVGETDEEIPYDGKEVGGVITDLWWVSAMDADEAERRGLVLDGRWDFSVDVEPGTYVLESYVTMKDFHEDRDDYSTPTVHGRITRKVAEAV